MSVRIPMIEKASAMTIEGLLAETGGRVAGYGVREARFLAECFRRIAVCRFKMTASPQALCDYLADAAASFAEWLAAHPGECPPAKAWDALCDALAAEDQATARAIAGTAWAAGGYDDDAWAVLLGAVVLGRAPTPLAEDHRCELSNAIEAIAAADADACTAALTAHLDECWSDTQERWAASGRRGDAAHTTETMSIPGIALVKLARARGMAVAIQHRLLPAEALLPPEPIARDDWRALPSYRSFRRA